MTVKRILGLGKLNNKLRRLPDAPKKEIRDAMARQADRITAMMRNLVPEDTGALKESIGWTFGKVPRGKLTIGKLVSANIGGDLTITIYAGDDDPNGAFYARWVEFGTEAGVRGQRVGARSTDVRQAKGKGRLSYRTHPGTPAQPFFFPAYRASRKSTRRAITTAVRKAARKVAQS